MASAEPCAQRRGSDTGGGAPGRRPSTVREWRTDVLVALGTFVIGLGLVLGLPPLDAADPDAPASAGAWPTVGGGPWLALVVGLLVQSAVLLAVRRAPRSTLVAVSVVPVLAAVAPTTMHGLLLLPVVVAVVLAVLRIPLARLWPALVTAAALVIVAEGSAAAADGIARAEEINIGQGLLQALGTVGLPALIALVIRSRRDVRAARTAEASAVNREQDALVDVAISRERAAMARELHDIAAHHLSGIALMSAVIDRQIDTKPERAHEGARQVREQSTALLEDLRRLVGLLRDDSSATRTVETIAGVVDLVERSRFRTDVHLVIRPAEGTDRGSRPLGDGVGPLAQLAAYRTVQEALANTVMHAPGAPCTVAIDDRADDHLTVRVDNGPSSVPAMGSTPAGGNGLRGMRERAELVGAELQVGPTDDGGWTVALTLAREAHAVSDTQPEGPAVAR